MVKSGKPVKKEPKKKIATKPKAAKKTKKSDPDQLTMSQFVKPVARSSDQAEKPVDRSSDQMEQSNSDEDREGIAQEDTAHAVEMHQGGNNVQGFGHRKGFVDPAFEPSRHETTEEIDIAQGDMDGAGDTGQEGSGGEEDLPVDHYQHPYQNGYSKENPFLPPDFDLDPEYPYTTNIIFTAYHPRLLCYAQHRMIEEYNKELKRISNRWNGLSAKEQKQYFDLYHSFEEEWYESRGLKRPAGNKFTPPLPLIRRVFGQEEGEEEDEEEGSDEDV